MATDAVRGPSHSPPRRAGQSGHEGSSSPRKNLSPLGRSWGQLSSVLRQCKGQALRQGDRRCGRLCGDRGPGSTRCETEGSGAPRLGWGWQCCNSWGGGACQASGSRRVDPCGCCRLTGARGPRSLAPGRASRFSPGAATPAGWSGPHRRTEVGSERQTQPPSPTPAAARGSGPGPCPGGDGWPGESNRAWGGWRDLWLTLGPSAMSEARAGAHLGHRREEGLQQGGHRLGALQHPGAAGHGLQQQVEWRQPGDRAQPAECPPRDTL